MCWNQVWSTQHCLIGEELLLKLKNSQARAGLLHLGLQWALCSACFVPTVCSAELLAAPSCHISLELCSVMRLESLTAAVCVCVPVFGHIVCVLWPGGSRVAARQWVGGTPGCSTSSTHTFRTTSPVSNPELSSPAGARTARAAAVRNGAEVPQECSAMTSVWALLGGTRCLVCWLCVVFSSVSPFCCKQHHGM